MSLCFFLSLVMDNFLTMLGKLNILKVRRLLKKHKVMPTIDQLKTVYKERTGTEPSEDMLKYSLLCTFTTFIAELNNTLISLLDAGLITESELKREPEQVYKNLVQKMVKYQKKCQGHSKTMSQVQEFLH